VCGKPEFEKYKDQDSLLNPTLIIEVLSESTEQRDRFEKLLAYKRKETLRGYLLVHQDRPLIEIYTRSSSTAVWEFDTVEGLESTLYLAALDCTVPLSGLYNEVEFETAADVHPPLQTAV
jgi:Uma2 family endonuclease